MTGRTILHTAAEYATTETLLPLTGFNLHGIDVYEKDNEDCSIFQLFDARCDAGDVGLKRAFERFVEMLITRRDDEPDEPDEFHDALTEVAVV